MPSSTNQKRGEKKRKIRPNQPTYIIRGDDALGIPEMRGEIGPSVKMVKESTQGVVHNLFMIANATLEADEKFKDFDEFFAHGYEFLKKMTIGLDVPNYSDVRNSTLSYLYLQRTVEDIFETGAMAYIGLNDANPVERCKQHRTAIRTYLTAEDEDIANEVDTSDQTFAVATNDGRYLYTHVCLPKIIRTAHRILEDICMSSLKAAVNQGILANVNEGENQKNYKDYGIDSEADILAIGAILLAHLLDTEPLEIDALEMTKVVRQAEFHCPICNEKLGRLYRVKEHLTRKHDKTEKEAEEMAKSVEKIKCSFGCGAEFNMFRFLAPHERKCENNPQKEMKTECSYVERGCIKTFNDEESMLVHAEGHCSRNDKNKHSMIPCKNVVKGCPRLFSLLNSAQVHANHECKHGSKIRQIKCTYCDKTFSKLYKKNQHELNFCTKSPNYVPPEEAALVCTIEGCKSKKKFKNAADLAQHVYRAHTLKMKKTNEK